MYTDFSTYIYTALNVSAITDLLDDYGSSKALFHGQVLPEDYSGNSSINFYRVDPINNLLPYGLGVYTASCRSATEQESIDLAAMVVNTINRVQVSGHMFKTSMLSTIPPADSTDNFNTPVSITIIKR